MKKTLLVVSVILLAAVFFACENQVQPVSGDVTLISKKAGTEAPANVTAEASPGYFLIKWDAAADADSYGIYRKTVAGGVAKDDAIVQVAGDVSNSSDNYYLWNISNNSSVKDGESYIFGVYASSLKGDGLISEIVWQAASGAVAAIKPPQNGAVPYVAPTVSLNLTRSNKDLTYYDQVVVKLGNLKAGYQYKVEYQYANVPGTPVKSEWSGLSMISGSLNPVTSSSNNYLFKPTWESDILPISSLPPSDNLKIRTVVTVTVANSSGNNNWHINVNQGSGVDDANNIDSNQVRSAVYNSK